MNNVNQPMPGERGPRELVPSTGDFPPQEPAWPGDIQEPAWPGEGQEPVIPLPPFVEPPENEPVAPLPPYVEPPHEPVAPLPPVVVPPQQPVFPGYCTVRFLHAAFGYEPVRITVGPRTASNNLAYAGMTGYGRVPDGFYTVTITTAATPRALLFQSTVPFRAGDIVTLALTRTASGLDLARISDAPCMNRPRNRACIRAINLCYGSPALDVVLNDGRVVFSDIGYKSITPFRLARPQEYAMYIAQTPYVLPSAFQDIETLEDLPIVVANYYLPGYGDVSPLSTFYVDAKAGGMYSVYILGAWNSSMRTKIVEDF